MKQLTSAGIALALLGAVSFATTKKCVGLSGCTVVETLSSGVQVTHEVAHGDEFETSPQRSYVWRNPSDWEVVTQE